jgi:hypothetical protein
VLGPRRDDSKLEKTAKYAPHNLCSSLYVIRMMEARSMRWAGQVARSGVMRLAYKILVGIHEVKGTLKNLDKHGRIKVKMNVVWGRFVCLSGSGLDRLLCIRK